MRLKSAHGDDVAVVLEAMDGDVERTSHNWQAVNFSR